MIRAKVLSGAAYGLNLADLAFTLHVLDGGGVELNPAVRLMMALHPLCFPAIKIVAAGALCLWLERQARRHRAARVGLAVITVFYGMVTMWHCAFLLTA